MKKLLITLWLIASAGLVYAAEYDIITVNATGITTNTSASSATIEYAKCNGTIVMISMDSSTNMVCAIETVDDFGMSLGGARSVATVTTNAIGTNAVLGTAVYTRNDKLKCSFYGSFDTNGTATAKLKLLVETK